ncbi:MAG: SUMF1/EgtB/PvdO family nonheme iron enzyme [Verrucomicrobiales bacterium]|nr:SUMF1/EgtB/PvdO family nonheme iron enzyme [Verrucomicrobiales bacterium]
MKLSAFFLFTAVVLLSRPLSLSGQEKGPVAEVSRVSLQFEVEVAELQKPVKQLNRQYRGYLEKQKTAFRNAGDLEAMLAVEEEMKTFNSAGPEEDFSSYPELKRLQQIYRNQRSALDEKNRAAKLELIRKYQNTFSELTAVWTKEGEIEGAKLALAESKKLATAEKDPSLLATVEPPKTDTGQTGSKGSPGAATRDQPFENHLGMRFVPVPIEGGPTDGKTILFSVWETRVGDYEKFIRDERKREWPNAGFPQEDDHPAVNVNWDDAVAFCEWLTKEDRKKGKIGVKDYYRLPTDHEWSCAVGIGEEEDPSLFPQAKYKKLGKLYPWGKEWPPPEGAGNYRGEETASNPVGDGKVIEGYNDGYERTAPVGSFPLEHHGIRDLSGNAREWCQDWFDDTKEKRVLRGGSWVNGNESPLGSSFRDGYTPASRGSSVGFRCVCVVG